MHVTQLGRAATSLTFLWRAQQSKRTHKFRGAHGNAYGINFFATAQTVKTFYPEPLKQRITKRFIDFQNVSATFAPFDKIIPVIFNIALLRSIST
jgi:hypothetical protein